MKKFEFIYFGQLLIASSDYIFFMFNILFGKITANVLALGAVADFGAQNCQYTTKVDAR